MKVSKYSIYLWGFIPIIVFLFLWEIIARMNLVPGQYFFPPFSMVIAEFYHLILNGLLSYHFLRSLIRVVIGFLAGSIAGFFVGIVIGWNQLVDKALNPIISMFYSIPALGWLPFLMLWLGIGEILPILLIFISAFFPILYNIATGIKNVDKNFINVARSLGASTQDILMSVVIPLALPNIFTGLRLGSGIAWRVIIAAEMVAIPTGIGALMMRAESLMRIDIMIVCLMILAVMCLIFERFFILLEIKYTSRWR